MNARLIKETRDLLPFFGGALILIILPPLVWRGYDLSFGYASFWVVCAILGGASFGSEFQHRTLGLLLSQPIDRAVLWREKMLVLGAGLGMSLGVLLLCLRVTNPGINPQWWQAGLVALCAFCGAPYWTLLLRQGLAGMAFAAAVPVLISLTARLVTDRLVENREVQAYPAIGVLLIYCVLVRSLGYSRFRRLQVLDGALAELSLPAGLEEKLSRPLSRITSRFRGEFASLVRKELRLQQISFLLAGLFLLIALAGSCLLQPHRDPATLIVGGDFVIYVLLLPLVAGAVSVAEEKGWDLAEWHLTLPPSALKQWSAKMLAALSTSFVLGLVLPAAMLLAGDALFAKGDALNSLPPAPQILCWVLGQLLLTSVAVYAASFSSTTLKAILGAFAIIIAGWVVCYVVIDYATKFIAPRVLEYRRAPRYSLEVPDLLSILVPLLIAGGMILILCLIQWAAWCNFRRSQPSAGNVAVQILVFLLAGVLIVLAIAIFVLVMVAKSTVQLT